MRAILVDWLVEVQECFELYHETLYLGVKLLDHFLEKNSIQRDELQLVGATTLIISSKIEVIINISYSQVHLLTLISLSFEFIQSVITNFPLKKVNQMKACQLQRKSIIHSGS